MERGLACTGVTLTGSTYYIFNIHILLKSSSAMHMYACMCVCVHVCVCGLEVARKIDGVQITDILRYTATKEREGVTQKL